MRISFVSDGPGVDCVQAGIYRLRYFGDSKPIIGSISAFSGTSSNFTVA